MVVFSVCPPKREYGFPASLGSLVMKWILSVVAWVSVGWTLLDRLIGIVVSAFLPGAFPSFKWLYHPLISFPHSFISFVEGKANAYPFVDATSRWLFFSSLLLSPVTKTALIPDRLKRVRVAHSSIWSSRRCSNSPYEDLWASLSWWALV